MDARDTFLYDFNQCIDLFFLCDSAIEGLVLLRLETLELMVKEFTFKESLVLRPMLSCLSLDQLCVTTDLYFKIHHVFSTSAILICQMVLQLLADQIICVCFEDLIHSWLLF